MKLKELKLFNSVKVGSKEVLFAKYVDFDMELDLSTQLIKLVSKSDKAVTYTSMMNAPWFTELIEVKPKPSVRKRKKKEKKDTSGQS